ncbi:hypothetical protein RI509_08140 [Levilactobacillus namurensis]|uniref:hypothetical protein n=1 Tax=Levilactobacillus namurensis TaxID=380393 RepID=UPI0028BBEA22|nr:hypothetical protein [Levilactobacillus namurensis]MDT7019144.1 hypothetical protein [Levilactobacillus namurensis]
MFTVALIIALPGGQTGLERRGHNLTPQVHSLQAGLFLGEQKTLTKENVTAEPCLTTLTAYNRVTITEHDLPSSRGIQAYYSDYYQLKTGPILNRIRS